MEMMQKIGTPAPYGGFPLKIQDVAAPKDVDRHGDSTDRFKSPPPVSCNGQDIDMSAFPIQQPHPEDLHLVCCLIEHSLLPHIDRVIDHHEHMFVMRNIAHLLCKGHLDDIYCHSFYFITLSLQL
jgi:hypothetical protein